MIKFNKKSDKIAFIAPASGCNDKSGRLDLKKSLERLKKAIQIYEKNGFICVYGEAIFSEDKLGYFASPKEERLKQLQSAILDPEIKIIASFRGGYGCTEIVFDCIDIVPSIPKIFIGFSDITALHLLFNQKYKLPTIHGAMGLDQGGMIEEVFKVIGGKNVDFNLQSLNSKAKDSSLLVGEMAGGNLSLITNMIGTKLHPDFTDKIVFIEDVNEKGYHIHRSLMHMNNAGLFAGVKAVVFADFTNADDQVEESLREFSKEYIGDMAVFRTTGIGHGKINYPVVIGGKGEIADLRLKIISPFELV